jgi:5-formyltetrahydrofolate cyclo-ligase
MPADQRDAARLAIRRAVLQRCRDLGLAAGARIAAYQPLRTEPGSVELLADLHAAGYQVIVPYLLPDRDLDWLPWSPDRPAGDPGRVAEIAGPSAGHPDSPIAPVETLGSATPVETLGPAAIGTAALVLVPALAVDRAGHRLGRGGGSYDRALARVPTGIIVAALVFPGELVERVPTDPWDRPVTALVSPAGWLDLAGTGRGNA